MSRGLGRGWSWGREDIYYFSHEKREMMLNERYDINDRVTYFVLLVRRISHFCLDSTFQKEDITMKTSNIALLCRPYPICAWAAHVHHAFVCISIHMNTALSCRVLYILYTVRVQRVCECIILAKILLNFDSWFTIHLASAAMKANRPFVNQKCVYAVCSIYSWNLSEMAQNATINSPKQQTSINFCVYLDWNIQLFFSSSLNGTN